MELAAHRNNFLDKEDTPCVVPKDWDMNNKILYQMVLSIEGKKNQPWNPTFTKLPRTI